MPRRNPKPEEKRDPGRPPRAGTAAVAQISVKVTADERTAWEQAAGDQPLAKWMRDVLNRSAKRSS